MDIQTSLYLDNYNTAPKDRNQRRTRCDKLKGNSQYNNGYLEL